ncbi:MAG TPA: YetF domain-containing protein [Methylomirabilota bacterium]|nr:YetF domain-containing protein [Methylomirabilota bacterium]
MDPTMWSHMFALSLPVLEKILRPLIVYVFLIVGLRLAGKRELAQLNPFDLVVLLTLSNTVQNAIIGEDNSVTGGLIGAATLLAVNYLVVRFLYSHERLDQAVTGAADVLIENGRVKTERLRRELITIPELEAAAHRQGFASLDEIERAILEPSGTICFVGKTPSVEASRHQELVARLDQLGRELAALRGSRPAHP